MEPILSRIHTKAEYIITQKFRFVNSKFENIFRKKSRTRGFGLQKIVIFHSKVGFPY